MEITKSHVIALQVAYHFFLCDLDERKELQKLAQGSLADKPLLCFIDPYLLQFSNGDYFRSLAGKPLLCFIDPRAQVRAVRVPAVEGIIGEHPKTASEYGYG